MIAPLDWFKKMVPDKLKEFGQKILLKIILEPQVTNPPSGLQFWLAKLDRNNHKVRPHRLNLHAKLFFKPGKA